MEEKHWSKEFNIEVKANGRHKCNAKCRRLLLDFELTPAEAFTLWKLTVDSPRVTAFLRGRLYHLITKEERQILKERWAKKDLIPFP